MKYDMKALSSCILFCGLTEDEIQIMLGNMQVVEKNFLKNVLIYSEGDPCNSIGIVLEGEIELQNIYPSGKIATLSSLRSGDIFGEAILFSRKNTYPISICSKTEAAILFIEKKDILNGLTQSPVFLNNFLRLLSSKLLLLNQKVKVLSLDTLRQKLSHFLLKAYSEQGTKKIATGMSRKKMAESLSVQRPSLSRELIKMKADGLIDFKKSTIQILDIDALEDILFM